MISFPKMIVPLLGLAFMWMTPFVTSTAYAACVPGDAGKIRYNSDHSMMEYCDSSNWIAMARKELLGGGGSNLNSGLIGHWKMDDASGSSTAVDSSGNGKTVTLNNMDTATSWVPGQVDGAVYFDGVDDYMSTNAAIEAYPMTVSAWFKGTNFAIGNFSDQAVGFAIYGVPGCLTAIYFNTNFNNRVYNEGGFCINSAEVYDNKWHMITFVVDAAGGRLYLDGVLKDAEAWVGTPGQYTQIYPFQIGGSGYYMVPGNRRTAGLMDDVRVYNRALPQAEIIQLMNSKTPGSIIYDAERSVMAFVTDKGVLAMGADASGAGGLSDGLRGYWKFDQSSGTTSIPDSSGNGQSLTLTNMDPATDWVPGYTGNSLMFNGSDEYATGPGVSPYASLPFTVTVWHKGTALALGDLDSNNNGFDLLTNGSCFTGVYINTYANRIYEPDNFCIPAAELHDGNWHLVAFVVDATSARLYLDGVLKDTEPWIGTPSVYSPTLSFKVGRRSYYGHWTTGNIDEVRIYNRALTVPEILAVKAYGLCANPTASEGSMIYNTNHNVVQYCNGTAWMGVGK